MTVGGAIQVRVMNFNTSSISKTGADIHKTAIHSSKFNGTMTNSFVKKGTYKIMKCNAIDNTIDNTK